MKYFLSILVLSSILFSYEIDFGEAKIVNEIFEVPIKIKAEEDYLALQFKIKYDEGLKFEGFEWGEITKGALNALNDKIPNEIRGAIASATALPKEGVVCTLKFRGKGEVKIEEFLVNDKPARLLKEKFVLKKK